MGKSNVFLKLTGEDGPVEGECNDHDHLREIDLNSWSWSVADPRVPPKVRVKAGSDPAKPKAKSETKTTSDGKPKISKLGFSKVTDRSTTRLLGALYRGEVFPTATLTIEERFEESPLPFYMKVEFTDIFILSFDWSASVESAGMTFSEEWELNYGTIRFKYHWRGGNAGWIEQGFNGPADLDDAIKKTPTTPAELNAIQDERIRDILKKQMKAK